MGRGQVKLTGAPLFRMHSQSMTGWRRAARRYVPEKRANLSRSSHTNISILGPSRIYEPERGEGCGVL